MLFVTYSPKTVKCWKHFFYMRLTRIVCVKQDISNFDSDPLTCDSALFPAKNSPNSVKSNHIFPERREEIEP